MGAELWNILDYQIKPVTGNSLLPLLYLGCTTNQRSIPFWKFLQFWSSSVFSGVFIAEEVDGVEDTAAEVQVLEAFLNMSPRFASVLMKQSWNYSPQVPHYQNFWIIGGQIKGILLYLYLNQEWFKNLKISNYTYTYPQNISSKISMLIIHTFFCHKFLLKKYVDWSEFHVE